MISKEHEAEILRLYYAEKWRVGTIARQKGIHYSAVRRVIAQESSVRALPAKARLVDPFLPFITETLKNYPTLTATRLFCMVKTRGYCGQISQFRSVVAELRERRFKEPYLRLKTLPGEQAQVDWGHFGHFQYGSALRPLMAFVIVLSYSRAIYLRFFLSQNLSNFLSGHEYAFRWFGGVARTCLYDNLKAVVLERSGNAIRFNPQFLAYSGHYRFKPQPVAVARGNEKGRTERAIRYVRTAFFAARRFTDLDDLNSQALLWCETDSLSRRWPEDTARSVEEVLLEEKPQLLTLPDNPYPVEERTEVSIGKTPYARFDLNDYSVPPEFVQRSLVLFASTNTVRILDGATVIATHSRSYDRRKTVEDPKHTAALTHWKHQAREHRNTSVLSDACPSSKELLSRMAARGLPLASATNELVTLLHTYGAESLEHAILEALNSNTPHPHAVRHVLERARRAEGKAPALPLPLKEDGRLRNLIVKPHSLTSYTNLLKDKDDEDSE